MLTLDVPTTNCHRGETRWCLIYRCVNHSKLFPSHSQMIKYCHKTRSFCFTQNFLVTTLLWGWTAKHTNNLARLIYPILLTISCAGSLQYVWDSLNSKPRQKGTVRFSESRQKGTVCWRLLFLQKRVCSDSRRLSFSQRGTCICGTASNAHPRIPCRQSTGCTPEGYDGQTWQIISYRSCFGIS